MAIELIILTVLVEMTVIAWHVNARALEKGAVRQRIKDHALRDTASARSPQALRGFMRIPSRTMPRVSAHAPHANPWPDMAQSIADDVNISYYN